MVPTHNFTLAKWTGFVTIYVVIIAFFLAVIPETPKFPLHKHSVIELRGHVNTIAEVRIPLKYVCDVGDGIPIKLIVERPVIGTSNVDQTTFSARIVYTYGFHGKTLVFGGKIPEEKNAVYTNRVSVQLLTNVHHFTIRRAHIGIGSDRNVIHPTHESEFEEPAPSFITSIVCSVINLLIAGLAVGILGTVTIIIFAFTKDGPLPEEQ